MLVSFLQNVIVNNYTFYFALLVRIIHLFVVRTIYLPDEYWQSLEVAHHFVFGKGYLTWEWTHGIRSYLYVAFIALIYKILELVHMDSRYMVVLMPRLAQAILSAYADSCFVGMVKREGSVKQAAYALFAYTSFSYVAYTSTRTLINVVELNLTCIALYHYPFQKQQKSGSAFLWIVGVVCVLRPTAITIWLPLCLFHIFESQNPVKLFFKTYLPISLTTFTLSTLLDSYFHGSLVFTSFRFLWMNLYRDIASQFGSEPFEWYLIRGMPQHLGFLFVPLIRGPSKFDSVTLKLLSSLLFSLLVHSMIPHKEFRFLLPLMPAMMFIISDRMLVWFSALKNKYLRDCILFALLGYNVQTLVRFGMFQGSGALEIMEKVPVTPGTNLMILTGCHFTPYYSHLHANITANFLHCPRNIDESENHINEDAIFVGDPEKWLENKYGNKPDSEVPTHIICFEDQIEKMKTFLKEKHNYKVVENLWHSYGMNRICLLERQPKEISRFERQEKEK